MEVHVFAPLTVLGEYIKSLWKTLTGVPASVLKALTGLVNRPSRGVVAYFVFRQILSFSPPIAAIVIIRGYDEKTQWPAAVIGILNRIQGNVSPLGSAVFLLVLAGFLSTTINLVFYFKEIWSEVTDAKTANGKKWQLSAFIVLCVNIFMLGVFWFFLILAISGLFQGFGAEHEVMTDVLDFARWGAAGSFALFLLGDVCLLRSQTARGQVNDEKDRQAHENHLSLTRLSIGAIDVPALVMASATLYFIHLLRVDIQFHKVREPGWPTHVVLSDLPGNLAEIAIYGVETGILAATLITSQLVFAVLMARWQIKEAIIDKQYGRETGLAVEAAPDRNECGTGTPPPNTKQP